MKQAGRRRRVATGVAVSVGAAAAFGPAAQAADITVTKTVDNATGSLRDAIELANATPTTSDRILFQSGLSGTIELAGDLPALEGPVEIVGPGMDQMKVDGKGSYRIFESESDTSISGLTLANGAAPTGGNVVVRHGDLSLVKTRIEGGTSEGAGGGVAAEDGHLTIIDSQISGNSSDETGGGIAGFDISVAISGTTISGNEVTDSGFSARGGGAFFYLDGSKLSTIRDSEISDNIADISGGLQASKGDLAIDSSLFSGNSAGATGGAIGLGDLDGTGSYSIINSTITGNRASLGGAGMISIGAGTTLESSTVSGNIITWHEGGPQARGAGITQMNGPLTLRNSIVSGNVPADLVTLPSYPDPPVVAGHINGSFNLIGEKSDAQFTETVAGSNIASTDPQLGPLAENGGPTRTMLPAETSPVVNKGMSPLTVDQRGLTRPIDFNSIPFSTAAGANGADIGAVELQGGPLPPPSNAFTFGKVKLNKKKGVATLQVKVPGAGSVLLAGSKTVVKSSRTSTGKSTVNLTVKAKGKAAKQLKKKGSVKVEASVEFTPTGGTANTKSKTVKLAKKKPKKR